MTSEPSSTNVSSGGGGEMVEETTPLITPDPVHEPNNWIPWQGWLAGIGMLTLLVFIGVFLRWRKIGCMERGDG
jgi:hypothetical protein